MDNRVENKHIHGQRFHVIYIFSFIFSARHDLGDTFNLMG